MAPPPHRSASRYRRRILLIGAVLGLLLYVIGAPIFNNRIEDDLEQRVPVELAAAGFDGVVATFSGQDGTLTCERPLSDPEQALSAAYDIWGVRAIDIDRSCRVNRAPTVETTTTIDSDDDVDATSGVIDVDAASGGATSTASTVAATTVPVPDFDSVAEIVSTSPDLSLLAVLSAEAGFEDRIGASSPDETTLFAPADTAFDELPADAIARLREDPALLRRVLDHHAVDGSLPAESLVTGELVSLDGGTLTVVVDDSAVSVDEATVTHPDVVASNGVVHIIDRLLLPDDIDLTAPDPRAEASATYADAGYTLVGVVATEVERAALVTVASAAVGADAVADELEVDPGRGLEETTATAMAGLIEAIPVHLVAGTVRFDGVDLAVEGSYANEADRDAMLAVVDTFGATAQLAVRPAASDDEAVDLEVELNDFVAANPIRFEPSSATLTADASAVLDGVAERVLQFGGVAITIEGHTDSDGLEAQNLALSQLRAAAVLDGLVERGLDPATLTAEGLGSAQPVLVDGVEDKAASRRVEFRVVPSS